MEEIVNGLIIKTFSMTSSKIILTLLKNNGEIRSYLLRINQKKSYLKVASKTGSRVELLVKENKLHPDKLGQVKKVEKHQQFKNIESDITLSAYSQYLFVLFDLAFSQNQNLEVNPIIYQELMRALELIDQGIDPKIVLNIVELQWMNYFGVNYDFTRDVLDGTSQGEFDFSDKYDGLIEAKNFELDPYRFHLSKESIYYLNKLSKVNLLNIQKINVSQSFQREIQKVIDYIYQEKIGIHPMPKHFLEKMQKQDLNKYKIN